MSQMGGSTGTPSAPTPEQWRRLRDWLMPSGATRAQLHRIEHKLDRLAWHWTRLHLSLPISGPTTRTFPTSTDTTTTSPMAAPDTHKSPPLLKHGLRYVPKVVGWLAEKLMSVALPYLAPILAGAWALGRDRLEAAWQWLGACWHWVIG